jgi:hypothetical protein
VERAGARGSRAEGGGGGEAAAQWGPCRRSCTGERCPFEEPGRDGRKARARGGRAAARRARAREDGRRCGEGGRGAGYDGGATTEV